MSFSMAFLRSSLRFSALPRRFLNVSPSEARSNCELPAAVRYSFEA
jgi:hypothetical protein